MRWASIRWHSRPMADAVIPGGNDTEQKRFRQLEPTPALIAAFFADRARRSARHDRGRLLHRRHAR